MFIMVGAEKGATAVGSAGTIVGTLGFQKPATMGWIAEGAAAGPDIGPT